MKLEDFEQELQIIRAAGFNPTAVGYFLEKRKGVVFKTTAETDRAYTKLDQVCTGNDTDLDLYWFSEEEENVENILDNIIWLNEQKNDKMQEKSLEELEQSGFTPTGLQAALAQLQELCYNRAKEAGWHTDLNTGELLDRNKGEMLCLIHSEISEAMEGERKNLRDDKLVNRPMAEVELADAVIRIFDYCGRWGYDLSGAFFEKLEFNKNRPDHQIENRLKENGKKF